MTNMVKVKIMLEGGRPPEYKKPGDAGADVRAVPNSNSETGAYIIRPGQTILVPLGFRVAIPEGWEMQVRSRSGLSAQGIVVANAPGTIDSGYRGPVMVLLHNQSKRVFKFEAWERIAQIVMKRAPVAEFELVNTLDETERGTGGFGSTGSR